MVSCIGFVYISEICIDFFRVVSPPEPEKDKDDPMHAAATPESRVPGAFTPQVAQPGPFN